MKKLVMFLAAMAVVSIAQAQIIRYNPDQLKKKAATSTGTNHQEYSSRKIGVKLFNTGIKPTLIIK